MHGQMTMALFLFTINRLGFRPDRGHVVRHDVFDTVYVFGAAKDWGCSSGTRAKPNASAANAMVFLLPSVFSFRVHFPRETMPWILLRARALFPTTYFIGTYRAIILPAQIFSNIGRTFY